MAQRHPALLWATAIFVCNYDNIYCLICSAINCGWPHIHFTSLQAWCYMPMGRWYLNRCLRTSICEYLPMMTEEVFYTDQALLSTDLAQLSVLTITTTPMSILWQHHSNQYILINNDATTTVTTINNWSTTAVSYSRNSLWSESTKIINILTNRSRCQFVSWAWTSPRCWWIWPHSCFYM